jgi:imidazolonepropionase-like amidohydrolase
LDFGNEKIHTFVIRNLKRSKKMNDIREFIYSVPFFSEKMKLRNAGFFIFSLMFFFSFQGFAQKDLVIEGACIINTNGNRPLQNSTILIRDNKIIDMGSSLQVQVPEDAERIDASGKYIIPGLIDGHIHFFQSGGLYTRPDGLDLQHRRSYEEEIQWIRDNIDDVFMRYIRCGITTVIDLGGPYWNFDVREKAKNTKLSPRVYTPGPLITPYMPDVFKTEDPAFVLVNSEEEARQEVRKQVQHKADLIKIWYIVGRGHTAEGFFPIAKAIVEESHKNKLPCFVHATELETAKKAMEAGCDVLVHNVRDQEIDKDFLKLAKKNNVILIPTMWVFESYASVYGKKLKLLAVEHLLGNPYIISTFFDMFLLGETELGERHKKLQADPDPVESSAVLLTNLKRIQDHGICVAAGTDAGNVGVLHGPSLFHEFALMEKAGLSNEEILIDATLNGAKLLNLDDKLGSIDIGKLADMVILNSNPLEDIQNTTDIYLVIKDGHLFYPDEVLKYSPEDLAQIQLNAYNSRDIESFLMVYHPDVEVYIFPDSLMYKGRDAMRKRYEPFFEKAKGLHCELLNRISYKNYVFDREFIRTGIPGRETFEGQAIYECEGKYIKKVWFIK